MPLESLAQRVIVQPPRHKVHRQKAVVSFGPAGIESAAALLAILIQRTKAHHQVGTYVYVMPAAEPAMFDAYAIPETQGCAAEWLLSRVRFLVGLYLPVRGTLSASAGDIAEDLAVHLGDLSHA